MATDLRVQELDFDLIKSNIKDFMRSRPEFTDYDFEGSGLSQLLNVLAYSTHYLAVMANMNMGELFLDTATKRVTAGLHAARLGYIPGSKRSATAIVNLEIFPTDSPTTLTIGKGAAFSTQVGGETFSFVTTDAKTIARSSTGRYVFENLSIREGTLKTFRYLNSESKPQKFMIPSDFVDISTLKVNIQISESNTSTATWQLNQSIADINSSSQVYYLRLDSSGWYEVYFGDGVLSKQLSEGNLVVLEYVETNGSGTNGANVFTFDDIIQGYSSNLVTTVQGSFGGKAEETADEIRRNAQQATGAQNRAVTADDYYSAVRKVYPYSSMTVWGGEQNDPPVYGKVFIAIQPTETDYLSSSIKEYIKSSLVKQLNVVTVSPVIVDPSYVYIQLSSVVYYNDNVTSLSSSSLETVIKSAIVQYSSDSLGKFGGTFRFTKVGTTIDASDSSIESNITKVKLRKEIIPDWIQVSGYVVDFGNPFEPNTLSTTPFYMDDIQSPMYMEDNNGTVQIFYYDGSVKKIHKSNVGTFDYYKGKISLTAINVVAYGISTVNFVVTPKSNDIFSMRGNILKLNSDDVSVSAIVEQKDPTLHIFTASR